ncbi:hypothetical protein BCR43DRAFT_105151 [Syncephalastrum racemosum]|uniref:SET domain-containing protein n=1 Tax=Syncephalastrum racemosum TaxID=13706 RepID=A0A1X2H1Q0_SYNRA|nr:hypothetical protein BCR43DRAFT_105151 [Syncephalastrum racemosum]
MAKYYSSADDDLDVDEDAVDTGLIRCVCNSSEDDGFTIQCERCLVWQHAFCVRVSQNNIPEHYLCDRCERKYAAPYSSVNGNKSARYSENNGRSMDKESRPKSDGQLYNANKKRDDKGKGRVQTEKQHFRDIYNRVRQSADEDDDRLTQPALPRPSPPQQQQMVQQQQQQQQKRNPVGRPPSKKPKLSKRISVPKRSLQDLSESERVRRKRKTTNTSSSPSSSSPERFEHISQNRLRSKHVQQVHRQAHKEACERWSKQGQSVAARSTGVVFLHDLQPIAETSIRQLPKSLYNSLQRNRRPRKGLFAESRLPANQFVTVLLGDVFLKSEYKFDPTNDFALLGTSCSHVFFYPTLDLCIDARHRGNDARHIRRSCQPNAEVRPIVLPHAENDASVHLGVFTRDAIDPGEELTIGWNWQKGHISWKKNLEWHDLHRGNGSHHHQVIDEEEERGKRALVLDMLKYFSEEIGDCACDELDLCFIEHLKKEARGYSSAVEPWLETSLPLPTRKLAKLEASTASGGSTHSTSTFPTNHSRASSRQSIVARGDMSEKGTILESGEDIDIVSTSPLVQSPRIQQQSQTMPSETEEELDIDGDIDVEDAPSNKGSGTRRTSVSSQSTFSTVSDPTGKAKTGKPPKLPCKKIWMRSFMHHHPPPAPHSEPIPAVSVTPGNVLSICVCTTS